MRTTILTVLNVAAVLVTLAAGLSVIADHGSKTDRRLFAADDKHRYAMIERSCGRNAQLWQKPITGELACVYVNRNGEALLATVPDAPLLSAQR